MKTAEELLKENGITHETAHHNYAYVYRAVCDLIGEAQKEAYNQAIDDAAKKAKVKRFMTRYDYPVYCVDKQSILKLKK